MNFDRFSGSPDCFVENFGEAVSDLFSDEIFDEMEEQNLFDSDTWFEWCEKYAYDRFWMEGDKRKPHSVDAVCRIIVRAWKIYNINPVKTDANEEVQSNKRG